MSNTIDTEVVHMDPRTRGTVVKSTAPCMRRYQLACGLRVWVDDEQREEARFLGSSLSSSHPLKSKILAIKDTPTLGEIKITVDKRKVTCPHC